MLRRLLNAIATALHLDVTPEDVRHAREADDAKRMQPGWRAKYVLAREESTPPAARES